MSDRAKLPGNLSTRLGKRAEKDDFFRSLQGCIDDALSACSQTGDHRNMRLAYFMAHATARMPITFSMFAEFDQGTIGTPEPVTMRQIIPQDVFILETVYTIARPNYATSSLGTPNSNYYNAKSPGINLQLSVAGGIFGDQYNVNIDYTPIENLLPHADRPQVSGSTWPTNWYLPYATEPQATAVLTRALADSEIPYQLAITMKAMPLKCRSLEGMAGNIGFSDMLQFMQSEGFLIA